MQPPTHCSPLPPRPKRHEGGAASQLRAQLEKIPNETYQQHNRLCRSVFNFLTKDKKKEVCTYGHGKNGKCEFANSWEQLKRPPNYVAHLPNQEGPDLTLSSCYDNQEPTITLPFASFYPTKYSKFCLENPYAALFGRICYDWLFTPGMKEPMIFLFIFAL